MVNETVKVFKTAAGMDFEPKSTNNYRNKTSPTTAAADKNDNRNGSKSLEIKQDGPGELLPHVDTLTDINVIQDWNDLMEIYRDDLKWLLMLPHNQFWSIMTSSSAISSQVLELFLNFAPRFYQSEFDIYLNHPVIGPLYQSIYGLVFRVYIRLSILKEGKEDRMTPENWANLLSKFNLVEIQKLMDLCALYENSENSILPKMIENIFRYIPRQEEYFKGYITNLMKKVTDFGKDIKEKLGGNFTIDEWNLKEYEDLLNNIMNIVISLCKFLKIYPAACSQFQDFINAVAESYELNIQFWEKIIFQHLPVFETQVHVLRVYFLRLVRQILATPTILSGKTSEDLKIDDYFGVLSVFLDLKLLLLDYEKAYPFKRDMQTLLSSGIVIDETRIDYVSNAIASHFEANGENYVEEKAVTDPLYDPNFDRQLLGACSLDVVGVELKSLISQVKDLLPELPDAYVKVCLKHFGFNAETTINALLEGNVPEHLEKYRDEEYVKSRQSPTTIDINNEPIKDDLPGSIFNQSDKDLSTKFVESKKNRKDPNEETFFEESKLLKQRILQNLEADAKAKAKELKESSKSKPTNSVLPQLQNDKSISYVDEELLPTYNEAIEYNDEYDDTYDEAGIGMTEPDNILYKPLNRKVEEVSNNGRVEEEEDKSTSSMPSTSRKPFEEFVENPELVRARAEQRRETKYQNQHRNSPPPHHKDVFGRAKGQGQNKEVLLNRRHKDQAGSHNRRNRSDFKRKEF